MDDTNKISQCHVQLKTTAVKHRTNFSPSLPHLLTEYGFQDKEAERLKKAKEDEKRRRRAAKMQKPDSFDEFEEERIMAKEKERDEQCLQFVKDVYRLRDYYYKEYNSLLSEKVEGQRKKLKEIDDHFKKEREIKEEIERKESHKVKPRLKRHTLDKTPQAIHVPKTDLYMIIGLENKLRREGKLKTVMDYNKFRAEIERPEVFYSNFKVRKNMDFNQYPSSLQDHQSSYSQGESNDSLHSLEQKPGQKGAHEEWSLGRISESQESSRPETQPENWAVTQLYHSSHKRRNSLLHSSKARADELDKKFPKLEMPQLHCFTMDLTKKPPDPEEVQIDEDLKMKERERRRMARTINKMYQLAMSNSAVTARIMGQHDEDDMNMLINGPDLCDVIADHHWMQAYGLHDNSARNISQEMEEPHQGLSLTESKLQPLPGISSRQTTASSIKSRSVSASRNGSPAVESPTEPDEDKPMLPLTMNEIKEKCNIVEAKTLSTLWTNYLRAGK
ncbi:unnamed protein product [Lymnaea stagnalis]|uniref:Uncharacterized protein n=1 Tax=Lymnaea stagnalis TaxID=6523 RepID=A0AAV2I7X6_LYMST